MLKAYEYNENIDLSINHKEPVLSKKEITLAKHVVSEIQQKNGKMSGSYDLCPVCGRRGSEPLYQKWNVVYLRCRFCQSIYCDCTDEQAELYTKNKELMGLRSSAEYQQDASVRRIESWEETSRWLQFRIYRYLGRRDGLTIIDYGNRYEGFIKLLRQAPYCGQYFLRESILSSINEYNSGGEEILADVLLYRNVLQQDRKPEEKLLRLREQIKKDGLIVIASRAGSGFDILALQEAHEYIYPYEHITLPSVRGLMQLLGKTGYEILEVTTPGSMDVNYVYNNRQNIKAGNLFLKSMMEQQGKGTLQEFQRFLQKNCMSSFVQMIARRK